MKNFIALVTFAVIAFSCGKKNGNMVVTGKIKGLKKGTLYLQKKIDTAIVSVDSIKIYGDNTFVLTDNVKSPEVYFITFDSNSQERKILFFGEQGNITINDNIEEFGWKPEISGSKNHEIFEKFKMLDQRYKLKRLDFIKRDIEARAQKDTALIKKLEQDYRKMVNRRFASTIQFSLNNTDAEATPYIALTELFDANIVYLDSINNNLTAKVKESTYGKQLKKYISDVKASLKK